MKKSYLALLLLIGFYQAVGQKRNHHPYVPVATKTYLVIAKNNSTILNKIVFKDSSSSKLFLVLPNVGDTITDKTRFKNLTLNSIASDAQLSVTNARFTNLEIDSSFDEVMISNSTINGEMNFGNSESIIHTVAIDNTKILGDLNFQTDILNQLMISNTIIKGNVELSGVKIDKNSSITGIVKGSLDLSGVKLYNGATLDLTYLKHDSTFRDDRIPIILTEATVGNIDLNYKYFKLTFNPKTPPDLQQKTYEDLLYSFKIKNKQDDYRLLEKDYRHLENDGTLHGRFINWMEDRKEEYGTKIGFMAEFTLLIFLIFSLINIYFYEYLNVEIYKVDNFKPDEIRQTIPRWVFPFYCSIIYTSVIFINPLLKLENLYYKKLLPLFYVLFMYFLGLFLLYYIVHYLLKF